MFSNELILTFFFFEGLPLFIMQFCGFNYCSAVSLYCIVATHLVSLKIAVSVRHVAQCIEKEKMWFAQKHNTVMSAGVCLRGRE